MVRHELRVAWLALVGAVLGGCPHVAEERARLDLEVGHQRTGALLVDVEEGSAAIRTLTLGELRLWASAPSLEATLRHEADTPATLSVRVENVVAASTLDVVGAERTVTASARGTELRVDLTLPPRAVVTMRLRPPAADDRSPFAFAVLADVQERIDDVDQVYARMNQEPGLRYLIFSGDQTRRGSPEELTEFQAKLKLLTIPCYGTLGNHELGTDERQYRVFFGRGNHRFVDRGVQFTLLDDASATLDPLVYTWLDTWLEEGRGRVHVVGMHIPIIDPVGTRNGSFASRAEAGKLLQRLADGDVDVTFYGHVHSFYAFANAGIPAYITGGGGAIPERMDGIGRHFLRVEVDPTAGIRSVAVVRVD